jgi:hypothetical protein
VPYHEVKQGEHVYRIARQHGLTNLELVWGDPQNAALSQERKNPHVLFPGDQLFVPEKQQKVEQQRTTAIHTFQINVQPLRPKLVVEDESDEPLANETCRLNVQGEIEERTTDVEGRLDKQIPELAEDAMLSIHGVEIPIKIGHLDPVDKVTGQLARLNNLGYDAGEMGEADDQKFRSAVEEFQCDAEIKPITGICDQETQDKLKFEHGC